MVRALGFCSVPVSLLLGPTPPTVLTPSQPPAAWFRSKGLDRCWALVLELMPVGVGRVRRLCISAHAWIQLWKQEGAEGGTGAGR